MFSLNVWWVGKWHILPEPGLSFNYFTGHEEGPRLWRCEASAALSPPRVWLHERRLTGSQWLHLAQPAVRPPSQRCYQHSCEGAICEDTGCSHLTLRAKPLSTFILCADFTTRKWPIQLWLDAGCWRADTRPSDKPKLSGCKLFVRVRPHHIRIENIDISSEVRYALSFKELHCNKWSDKVKW